MPDIILSRGEVRSLRDTGYEVTSDHKPNEQSILEALEAGEVNNNVSGSYSVLPGQTRAKGKSLTREEIIDALFRNNTDEENEIQSLRKQASERMQVLKAQLLQTSEEELYPLLVELRILEEAGKLNNNRVYRLRYDAIQRRLSDINYSAENCVELEDWIEGLLKSDQPNQKDSNLKIFEHHLNTGVLKEDAKVFKQLRIIFRVIEDPILEEKVQEADVLSSNLGDDVKEAESKWSVYKKFNSLGERFQSLYNNPIVIRDIIREFLDSKEVILFGREDRDQIEAPEGIMNELEVLLSSYTSITDKQRTILVDLLNTTVAVARKNQALANFRPCSNFQLLMRFYSSIEWRMREAGLPEECLGRLEVLRRFTEKCTKELKKPVPADKA